MFLLRCFETLRHSHCSRIASITLNINNDNYIYLPISDAVKCCHGDSIKRDQFLDFIGRYLRQQTTTNKKRRLLQEQNVEEEEEIEEEVEEEEEQEDEEEEEAE